MDGSFDFYIPCCPPLLQTVDGEMRGKGGNMQRGGGMTRTGGRRGEKMRTARGREVEVGGARQRCEEMRGTEIWRGKMRAFGVAEYGSD